MEILLFITSLFILLFLFILLLSMVASIFLNVLSWYCIYQDAKQKNNPEPMLWVIVSIFSFSIGTFIYVISQWGKTYENINKKYFYYLIFYFWFNIILFLCFIILINFIIMQLVLY